MASSRSGVPTRSGPIRTCIGCRSTDSWSALLRVVAVVGEDGGPVGLAPDPAHRMSGRGAWVHPTSDCFEQAVRRKAFVRALRLASGPDVAPVAAHLDLHPHDNA
nr:YlxR family protein [Lapillicoccus sp.]